MRSEWGGVEGCVCEGEGKVTMALMDEGKGCT